MKNIQLIFMFILNMFCVLKPAQEEHKSSVDEVEEACYKKSSQNPGYNLYTPALSKAVHLVPKKVIEYNTNVISVEISESNRIIVTCLDDKTVQILDLDTDEEYIINHEDTVNSMVISKDDNFVVTCSYDRTAKILNLSTREEQTINYDLSVISAVISNDSKFVVTYSFDGTAKIINLNTCEQQTINHARAVRSVVISNNGKFIVTRSDDGTVKIINLYTNEEQTIYHNDHIWSAVISKDSKFVVTCSEDGNAKLINVNTKEERIINHEGPVKSAVISNNSEFVVTCSLDRTAKILNLWTNEEYTINYEHPVKSAVISNDSKFVVICSEGTEAKIIFLHTGEQRTINSDTWFTWAVIPDHNNFVIMRSSQKGIVIIDHQGNIIKCICGSGATISEDTNFVVETGYKKILNIIDLYTDKECLFYSDDIINSLVISRSNDNQYIVFSSGRTVNIIDLQVALPDYLKKLNVFQINLINYLYKKKGDGGGWIYLDRKQFAIFNSLPDRAKDNLLKHYAVYKKLNVFRKMIALIKSS